MRTFHSSQGVEELIAKACAVQETNLLAQHLSPLFPELAPWETCASIPDKQALQLNPLLQAVVQGVAEFRDALTKTAGQLSKYLDADDAAIRDIAMEFSRRRMPGTMKLSWAEQLLGITIPGSSIETRMARLDDARYWRRAIRVRLMREREHFFMRLKLVGVRAEAYVSDLQLTTRLGQLKRQQEWMKQTVLVPRYLPPSQQDKDLMTLDKVCKTPSHRFNKLYAFVKAMDEIAQEEGLAAGMLTLTLEPEWHPNPSHGKSCWNGRSPREAHASLAKRWQSILRDLHRYGIGLSGLRVVEPHRDGCPHWHLWLLYTPKHQQRILEVIMRYFPNKLRLRLPTKKGEKTGSRDIIFSSGKALHDGLGRCPKHPKEGAQVELSCIDRAISSGASYAMKYLLKTVEAGDELNTQVGLLPSNESEDVRNIRREQLKSAAQRVDAYRALWGINACQLFGVAKCLTAWDELRSLNEAPENEQLKALWVLARGTDAEGRIPANASIRGNAKGFIQALGGLAAAGCKTPREQAGLSIARLTEHAQNGYGDPIVRTVGIALVQKQRERVERITDDGVIKKVWKRCKTQLATIRTRVNEWFFANAKNAELHKGMAIARYLAS